MDPLLKRALHRTLCFLLLTFLAPLLFVHVEYTERDDKQEKYQLLFSLYKSMASKYNMSLEEFNNFSNIAYEGLSVPKPRWTYMSAIDFVLQAITTIGYGYITPQTPTGQILCVFVSVLGIPITLLSLNSVGELISKLISTALTKFEKKVLKRAEPQQVKSKTAATLLLLMAMIMMMAGLIPNTTRHPKMTGWTFVEGVYFWFVTFSTIGFGDYTLDEPNERIKQLYVNNSTNQEFEDDLFQATDALYSISFLVIYMTCLCIVSSLLNSIMAAIEERKCRPDCPGCFPYKRQHHVSSEQHQGQDNKEEVSVVMEL